MVKKCHSEFYLAKGGDATEGKRVLWKENWHEAWKHYFDRR